LAELNRSRCFTILENTCENFSLVSYLFESHLKFVSFFFSPIYL
jgi:hypothetical protein